MEQVQPCATASGLPGGCLDDFIPSERHLPRCFPKTALGSRPKSHKPQSLNRDLTVTNIVLFSVGGVTTNGNNWAALYTKNLVLLAQSTNDTTSTDFAANTKITKALTSLA